MTLKKIAIIGTGISGMAAAYMLHLHCEIVVYEKNEIVGGHSRTRDVKTSDGTVAVDTGFIVFNKRNYPLLVKLFEHLNVPIAKSDMSFGVSIADGWLEYGTRKPWHVLAQLQNIIRPQFWGLLRDLFKFNAQAKQFAQKHPEATLEDCVAVLKLGEWFKNYYLLAMGAAIWSMPLQKMLDFPANSFIQFFDNHGLLTITDHPQWYTVRGGSREYVARLIKSYEDKIRINCGVISVKRVESGVEITDSNGTVELFDEVVFACHADQALRMIDAPTDTERRILSNFEYSTNIMILHSDESFMPHNKTTWASWVYLSSGKIDATHNVSLSYWMNNLQPLPTKTNIFVTLNPAKRPLEHLIFDEAKLEHPIFNEAAIHNQPKLIDIQGQNKFWFCGAYQRYGFHEDGLYSAVKMVQQMGITPEWI